jgi:hypothetical protein
MAKMSFWFHDLEAIVTFDQHMDIVGMARTFIDDV